MLCNQRVCESERKCFLTVEMGVDVNCESEIGVCKYGVSCDMSFVYNRTCV